MIGESHHVVGGINCSKGEDIPLFGGMTCSATEGYSPPPQTAAQKFHRMFT